jgi:hypothetical protein
MNVAAAQLGPEAEWVLLKAVATFGTSMHKVWDATETSVEAVKINFEILGKLLEVYDAAKEEGRELDIDECLEVFAAMAERLKAEAAGEDGEESEGGPHRSTEE